MYSIKNFDAPIEKPVSLITGQPLYHFKDKYEYNKLCSELESFILRERSRLFSGLGKKYPVLYGLEPENGNVTEYVLNNVFFEYPYYYPLLSYEQYNSEKFQKRLNINDFIRNFNKNKQEDIWDYFESFYVDVNYKGVINKSRMKCVRDYVSIGVNYMKRRLSSVNLTDDLTHIMNVSHIIKKEIQLIENPTEHDYRDYKVCNWIRPSKDNKEDVKFIKDVMDNYHVYYAKDKEFRCVEKKIQWKGFRFQL